MVEAQPLFRVVRPAGPGSIRQSWACFRQITVPDLIGLLANPNAVSLAPSGFVKKAELDALCVFGKQCEVNSLAIPGCAQGIRFSRPDSQPCLSLQRTAFNVGFHSRSGRHPIRRSTELTGLRVRNLSTLKTKSGHALTDIR